MYLGHLAKGADTAITASNIREGLASVFDDLSQGKTLNEVIVKYTDFGGLTAFENNVFNNPSADTISFVKQLRTAIGSGAGSLFGIDLSDTTATVFANPSDSGLNYYKIDTTNTQIKNNFGQAVNWAIGGLGDDPSSRVASKGGLMLQVGALSGQAIRVNIDAMNSTNIGINNLSMESYEKAGKAMAKIDAAIEKVSTQRSDLGAKQNRLEHTVLNLDNTQENAQSAESRIRDTDMAAEMVRYSAANIIEQAGQAMVAQANQTPQGVLSLLQ
ncbi:MAG: flagellin [Lachnospiraceae bacterium]|nr:flagellin [Lachnospiraceae bacterium]